VNLCLAEVTLAAAETAASGGSSSVFSALLCR